MDCVDTPKKPNRFRWLVGSCLVLICLIIVLAAPFDSDQQDRSPRQPRLSIPTPSYSPLVRVNLTPTASKSIKLKVDGPYRLSPVRSSKILEKRPNLGPTTVTVSSTGLRIGSQTLAVTRIEIVPIKSPAVWINDRLYRGRVRFFRRSDKTLIAVNVVAMQDYIASVIDSEMPSSFPDSARQAQAIAARTYALIGIQGASRNSLFDLYADSRSQQYLGYQYHDRDGRLLAGESANSRKLAQQTAGMVCTYQKKLFRTYYSAVCGGHTTTGKFVFADAAPPLTSVKCDWCRESERYRWQVIASRKEVSTGLKRYLNLQKKPFDDLKSLTRKTNNESRRVPEFEVTDGRHRYHISANVFRRRIPGLNLSSPYFEIRESSETITFDGQGHGHGVGLCQWGARGLGKSGKSCLEILNYYYPGAEVVILK